MLLQNNRNDLGRQLDNRLQGGGRKWIYVLAIIIAVIAVLVAGFFFYKYQDSQNKLKHPDQVAKEQTAALVDQVGKHTELPKDEQPTVATVSDVSKLSNQTFFANAQNGDRVLIYSKAKKAILYRPSEDKIINIAPLNINTSDQKK